MRYHILRNCLILTIISLFHSYGFCSNQNLLRGLNQHEKKLLANGKITQEQTKPVKNDLKREEKLEEMRTMI